LAEGEEHLRKQENAFRLPNAHLIDSTGIVRYRFPMLDETGSEYKHEISD
jgi:hypothetical protein